MLQSSKRPMFDSSAVFFVASFDRNATAAFGTAVHLDLKTWAPISSHDEVCNKDRFWADLNLQCRYRRKCRTFWEPSQINQYSVIPIDHARANMINTWYLMASSMPYVKMFFVLLFRCAWGPLVGVFFAKDRHHPLPRHSHTQAANDYISCCQHLSTCILHFLEKLWRHFVGMYFTYDDLPLSWTVSCSQGVAQDLVWKMPLSLGTDAFWSTGCA